MSKIIIGSDVVPYGKVEGLFSDGNLRAILGESLSKIWLGAEYRFFNLECPVTNSNKGINKNGPLLKCNPKTINGIKKLEPTCVMLANNHIMDYSVVGLEDTIKLLDGSGIDWIGVGKDAKNLKKTFSFRCDNKGITIYNCCEHEFSIATDTNPGANPYNELDIFDEIRESKKNSDYLVIVYHGGKEYYRYPSPLLQKRCRKMIDSGVDLVICQHSHCVGCEEKYKKGIIVYGQGNYIFNKRSNEFWDTSLLISIDVKNGFKTDYIPIVRTEDGTSLASEVQAKVILGSFSERSSEIKNQGFVEKKYREFAEERLDNYLMILSRHNRLLKLIHRISPKAFRAIKYKYAAILNVVECEAHNELLIEGLRGKLKKK